MPPKDWTFRITDILECIAKIQRYTEGMSMTEFEQNEMVLDAVIRNITVIGEATRYVPVEIQAKYAAVPWSLMRGMRNIVVHQYDDIDVDLTWDTVNRQIPPLIPLLNAIRDREPSVDDD